jgi:hypothetical protein
MTQIAQIKTETPLPFVLFAFSAVKKPPMKLICVLYEICG